jgi:hypothetical protein
LLKVCNRVLRIWEFGQNGAPPSVHLERESVDPTDTSHAALYLP